ncbi:hypothetical protein HDU67_010192, partial [Dinochytrium kinnereticum]
LYQYEPSLSNRDRVRLVSGCSVPFILAITAEIFLICIIITAGLLYVSITNNSISNNICLNQSISSIESLASAIQQRTADLVTASLNATVAGPVQSILDASKIHSVDILDITNYDRLWPYFFMQIKDHESVSLIYYGDSRWRDFVGIRKLQKDVDPETGKTIRVSYGVDLMDEGRLARVPSRCPQTCPANIASDPRNQTRFKYYLNESGRITGEVYEAATYDPTSRTWYKAATAISTSIPVWTDAYLFSNNVDIGITAAIQIFSKTDPSRVQGVLGSDMSFAVFKDQLKLLPLTPNGFAVVFDDVGNLYGSSVDGENVTSVDPISSVSTIKSVRGLVDPILRMSMSYVLSRLLSQNEIQNAKLNLSSLPSSATYRVPIPGGSPNSDIVLLLKRVNMGFGLRMNLLIGAPLSDYTGGIDGTSLELRNRLSSNTRMMLVIGAGVVLCFIVLSIPVSHYAFAAPLKRLASHMEEIARFEFASLYGKDRNRRSFLREVGVMQDAYWNMVKNFAKGLKENRRIQGGSSSGAISSNVPMSIPESSKAIVFSRYGAPDVLELTTVPTPTLTPTDDAVIVKIDAAGVNPVDYKVRQGDLSALLRLPFPAILGIDYAGHVVAVGSQAKGDLKVGDAVYGKLAGVSGKGTYAEYIRVSTRTDLVVKKPESLSAVDAAGVGVCALTAYVGLVTYNGLSLDHVDQPVGPDSKSVLVIGASGGVGSWAVQLSKKLGARVTAVASGRNKDFVVGALKADTFIDYTAAALDKQLTKQNEFDVIYDAVGGDQYWTLAQTILKPGGLFVTAVGSTEHGGKLTLYNLGGMVGSLAWRSLTNSRKYRFVSSLPVDQFDNLAKWIADGSLKCPPSTTIPLAEAKRAHELSASHRTVGKLILTP